MTDHIEATTRRRGQRAFIREWAHANATRREMNHYLLDVILEIVQHSDCMEPWTQFAEAVPNGPTIVDGEVVTSVAQAIAAVENEAGWSNAEALAAIGALRRAGWRPPYPVPESESRIPITIPEPEPSDNGVLFIPYALVAPRWFNGRDRVGPIPAAGDDGAPEVVMVPERFTEAGFDAFTQGYMAGRAGRSDFPSCSCGERCAHPDGGKS